VNLHVKKKPFNYKILRTEKFPTDVNEAYEHTLRQEDLPDDMIYASLDPLSRFQFRPTTKTDLLFQQWFVTSVGGNASDLGMLFEAAIACHALLRESYYNCKGQQTLRWNGGSGASWQDLICIKCECMYEVKTKADMEKVSKSFYHNEISGGSFSSFWKVNNSKRRNQKMFLVILPKTSTLNRIRQRVYPVQIAEIAHVLPRACLNTFNERISKTSGMRLKSTIFMKGAQARWFDFPEYERHQGASIR